MDNGEADRAAALMRQRMARSNQTLAMASPPAQQMAHGRPPPPPSMSQPMPGPPPPGAPRAVQRMTGSSRQIPPRSDPLNRYKNLHESATGSAVAQGDIMLGVNKLILGVLSAIAFAAIFVLPRQLKVFWVLIVGLTILISLGMVLYKELMEMSKGGGENAKYAEWAWVLLFSLTMMYTGVMVGILLFLAWSLYTIANSKTNIARNDAAILSDQEVGKGRRHRGRQAEPAQEEPAYV
jgi:hypothetical protein